MPANDNFRRYLDAGILLGQMTRARAEELVRELVDSGDLSREEAQQWADDLVERSRRTTELLMTTVKQEVTAQLRAIGITSVDDVAHRVSDLLGRAAAGRGGRGTPAPGGEATEAAPRAAKKTAAKKAAGKKGSTKKAAARTAAAKKASAKKATGKTGKKAAAPRAKAAGKKASAKRATAKKAKASGTRPTKKAR